MEIIIEDMAVFIVFHVKIPQGKPLPLCTGFNA
jgi:hypothetical protein